MSFLAFAQSYGLVLRDPIPDGRWHRVPTDDHPRKRNGAYAFDGERGAVQNWATMQQVALYRPDGAQRTIGRGEFRRQRRYARETARAHAKARHVAMEIIKTCTRSEHPYLAAKGFPKAQGLVSSDGELIIPMRDFRDYRTVDGVQRISCVDFSKKFLPGQKAKGAVFIIAKGAMRERWLVEGYATGLSVQAALLDLRRQAEVVVCFSAGNLEHVSTMVKPPAYVMADNDESKAGQRAAESTGLPWVMPPEVGMDANDWHQRSGLRSLVHLILSLSQVRQSA